MAVALEAARVFAARTDRQWSLLVLLTDGEEAGLMGAAALMTDRDVTRRLAAYLQVESIGSDGPALLFETGPANAWLVGPWARRAPHPRGGSFAVEIYKRLPNDTDFSIIKRQDIPGLNFAPVGDSYAYHTARDTPERLSPRTIRDTGENVVAILDALNAMDITRRSADAAHLLRRRRNGRRRLRTDCRLDPVDCGAGARRHRLGARHGGGGPDRRAAAAGC